MRTLVFMKLQSLRKFLPTLLVFLGERARVCIYAQEDLLRLQIIKKPRRVTALLYVDYTARFKYHTVFYLHANVMNVL